MKTYIKDFCKIHNLTKDQFCGIEEIQGHLYLSSLTSIPDGFNPTVGGHLYLRSLTSIPDGFNPTVGGSLDLSSLTSIPDGFNPTVGGSLYLRSGLSAETKPLQHDSLTWQEGKYVKVDSIFTEVLSVKGNIRKVKRISNDKQFYLITDGNGRYAHGDTIKEARADLVFKITENVDKSKFEGLKPKDKLSFSDAIDCYHAITGACSTGMRLFVEDKRLPKRGYTIDEIIALTKGAYGGQQFAQFFQP